MFLNDKHLDAWIRIFNIFDGVSVHVRARTHTHTHTHTHTRVDKVRFIAEIMASLGDTMLQDGSLSYKLMQF